MNIINNFDTHTNPTSLGQMIKKIRLQQGLGTENFGQLIKGANRGLVSKWENDQSVPGLERLHLIANLGGISFDELMKYSRKNKGRLFQYVSNDKIYAYAIAYVEERIKEHEEFISNFEGEKEDLVQFGLIERYKKELKELNQLNEELQLQ